MKMSAKCPKVGLYVSGIVAVMAVSAYAGGFRLPDQDAFATARGEAFTATADRPSAIYYNPAGISQLEGHNLQMGLYSIDLQPNYQSAAGGATYEDQECFLTAPQFFYTYGKQDLPVSFGLGVYAPYGLGLEWPQDTGFRTVGYRSALTNIAVNPVVAWKILPNLSVGVGVSVNWVKADLRQGLFAPTTPDDELKVVGDGWTVGYNFGVLWQPCEQISFGATFRSCMEVELDGHTTEFSNGFSVPQERRSVRLDLPMPYQFVLGVSYRPTPQWNLEFNYDYADWSSLHTVYIERSSATTLLPATLPLTFNWESSAYYEFGVTRYLESGWHMSGGYIFNEASIPESTFTPLVTDVDKHFFSVGFGRKGKRFDFDLAYQFGYGPTKTVSGSPNSITVPNAADGKYEFFSHAVAVSVLVHF